MIILRIDGNIMNQFKTDFLCTPSTFLMGFGSVVNMKGNLYDYNTSNDPDKLAIAQDWKMVGQDIRNSLDKAKSELRQTDRP